MKRDKLRFMLNLHFRKEHVEKILYNVLSKHRYEGIKGSSFANISSFIMNAFHWGSSKEGAHYWNTFHDFYPKKPNGICISTKGIIEK